MWGCRWEREEVEKGDRSGGEVQDGEEDICILILLNILIDKIINII